MDSEAVASLGKSGSSVEGGETQLISTGPSSKRVSGMKAENIKSLAQSLMLEPMITGDQKCNGSGELKKALGYSARSSKSAPQLDFEKLKRYKESVVDLSIKARLRAKKLDEHLHKLNKYVEVANIKMGVEVHQSLLEAVSQRLEDETKNSLTKTQDSCPDFDLV